MANLQTKKELERLVKRYRKRLGIDPVYSISISIVTDEQAKGKIPADAEATIQIDSTHPQARIFIRKNYITRCREFPRFIQRVLYHELLHIPIGEALEKIKPSYATNATDKDIKIEETLVSRLARAFVPIANEDLFNKK